MTYVLRVLPDTIQKPDYIVRHEFGNLYLLEGKKDVLGLWVSGSAQRKALNTGSVC